MLVAGGSGSGGDGGGCGKRELGFIECMMRVAAKMFVYI
jgi:hypothetical protein